MSSYSSVCLTHCQRPCLCSTGPQQLDNGCSAFERGGVDVCEFTAPAVGRIEGVALATDTRCGGVLCSQTMRRQQKIGTINVKIGDIAVKRSAMLHGPGREVEHIYHWQNAMTFVAGSDAATWCIRKLEVLQSSSDHVATFQPHNWVVG